MIKRQAILIIVLAISMATNCLLGGMYAYGRINAPSERLGVLRQDIALGKFGHDGVVFKLPKGITVRDESPRGFDAIDRFEPYRFSIVITSDHENLVDYGDVKLSEYENLYSADIKSK